MSETQNYKNHAKLVPAYHMFGYPILAVYFVWALLQAVKHPSLDTAMPALLGAGLMVTSYYARVFALRVQDRVIRLEMRLRMRELFPPDLAARIPEFTTAQLVSLRFASDAELPVLAKRVLDERLNDRKAIKLMIRDWQADNLRA
jgi:hypothetical protein